MNWILICLAFLIGVLVNKLWNVTISMGYSVLLFKQVQDDSVKMLGTVAQTLAEIEQLKVLEFRRLGKSDKEIEIARTVYGYHLTPLKAAAIQNFINRFPYRYKSILRFSDWESAMEYLDELIKEEKRISNKNRSKYAKKS
tara:strand:+ start:1229 stop:1651 length:423 start_codon:yes stop_codon:yes gene_type:complete